MLTDIIRQFREVPEYLIALKASLAVLVSGLPLYVGLRYFLYRRKLTISFLMSLHYVSVFILFAGLAFLLTSPLSSYLPPAAITAYLFVTCVAAAISVVSLIDVFLLQHYLSHIKKLYVSPPLRMVIKLGVFCLAILPILRFVLHFNPLALIALPTIATAGVALALQDTMKAFIAGVGLGHVIRIGEWITFQDKSGRVVDIDWGRTVIETVDGQRVFIPNPLLQTGIFLRHVAGNPNNNQNFKIKASCEIAPARVKETLIKSMEGIPGIASSPEPQVHIQEYADSGIVYGLFYAIEDYTARVKIQDEVASRIWYAFQREGIAIPYPTRTVHVQRSADMAKKARSHIQEALKRWTLAEAFFSEELQELSLSTQNRVFAPGEIIVRKGDAGHSLFAIVEGEVEIFATPDLDLPIARLGAHEIFGEMSLLTGEARSATVRAKTSVEVLEIEKTGLQKVIAKRPELSDRLAEMVQQRQAVLAATSGPSEMGQVDARKTDDHRPLAGKIRQFFGLA